MKKIWFGEGLQENFPEIDGLIFHVGVGKIFQKRRGLYKKGVEKK